MADPAVHDDPKLSILDFTHIYRGSTPTEALKNSTEVVTQADQQGYTRYWFTEHHNTKHQINTSPDLLIARAGEHSQRMRVGSGGIMLPNYSPLKVAENFTVLEALYPGRVDLGLGRSSGTNGVTALALHRSKEVMATNSFPDQLDELLGFLSRDFPEGHPYSTIKLPGDSSLMPEIFLLGSSAGAVEFAVKKGLGYAFAAHLSPKLAVPVLRSYRANFVPSSHLSKPHSILAIPVITAQTQEEAAFLAGPMELLWAKLVTGSPDHSLVSPEEAAAHDYTPSERSAIAANRPRFVIGDIKTVSRTLRDLAGDALADEIMIVDFHAEQEGRLRAYELLAKEFLL
jgi:luciferase family oxidoreductase group 1